MLGHPTMARGESWSCGVIPGSIDEDVLERMLHAHSERSESSIVSSFDALKAFSASEEQAYESRHGRRWSRLGRNVLNSVATALKYAVASGLSQHVSREQCRKAAWTGMLRSLTQSYPGSQLPEKLICKLRNHFDSMPLSYAKAGFDVQEVFHHVRLLEQVGHEARCQSAVVVLERSSETDRSSNVSDLSAGSVCSPVCSDEDELGSLEPFKVVFACKCIISRAAVVWALESGGVATLQQLLIFEKKGLTLGVAIVLCTKECSKLERMEDLVKAAMKTSRLSKLSHGFCGCEARETNWPATCQSTFEGQKKPAPATATSAILSAEFEADSLSCQVFGFPSPGSVHRVITDGKQTIVLGRTVLERYLLDSDKLVTGDPIHVGTSGLIFKGDYNGQIVAVKGLHGCEAGKVIDVELRTDVLCLISCKHKNLVPLLGICVDAQKGMCIAMKYMEGGSLSALIQRDGKLQFAEVIRLGIDIVEGLQFLHERGIVHREFTPSNILLDESKRAVIGDLGIVNCERNGGDGADNCWMAPEVMSSSDSGSLALTFMSNVYSFGMILKEMLMGIFTSYQQQATIATLPEDCPSQLKLLLHRCCAPSPLDRPTFRQVLELLRLAHLELRFLRPPS